MVSDENDLKLEDIPILRDFPNVFSNDLSGLPQKREVGVDLQFSCAYPLNQ